MEHRDVLENFVIPRQFMLFSRQITQHVVQKISVYGTLYGILLKAIAGRGSEIAKIQGSFSSHDHDFEDNVRCKIYILPTNLAVP